MLYLIAEIPFGAYLIPDSREFKQTYLIPPPVTVLGMLLSLVGEVDYKVHRNVKVFVGVQNLPLKSTILRTYHRRKVKDIRSPKNIRPDFQEILSLIDIAIAIDSTEETRKLSDRVYEALNFPQNLTRFGCLCLGESNHLVNDLKIVEKDKIINYQWLEEHEKGDYRLPALNVHEGNQKKAWKRFSLTSNLLEINL